MSLKGVSSVSFGIKSPASNFFQYFLVKTNFLNEGHAEIEIGTVGTENRRTRYKMSRFHITKEWCETLKETVTGDLAWQNPDCFKKLEGTITVIAKEDCDGADALWTVDYEKLPSGMDDPQFIIKTCVKFFTEMDENLIKSN